MFKFGEWVLIDGIMEAQIIQKDGESNYIIDVKGNWYTYEKSRITKKEVMQNNVTQGKTPKKIIKGIEVPHPLSPTRGFYRQQKRPINANELRIRNWLYYEHKDGMKAAQIKYGVELDYIKAGEIKAFPIPVTPEILVLSGFKESIFYGKSWHAWHSHNFDFIRLDENHNLINTLTGVVIRHVHQLQNLYFFLTGEELQSDF